MRNLWIIIIICIAQSPLAAQTIQESFAYFRPDRQVHGPRTPEEFQRNTTVIGFYLRKFNQDEFRFLRPLTNLRRVVIMVPDSTLGDGLRYLEELPHLEELVFSGGHKRYGNEILPYLQRLPLLRRLTLYDTAIDDRGMPVIGNMRQLESLAINSSISHHGLLRISQLSNLKVLELGNVRHGAGYQELGLLTNLEELYLYRGDITDDDMRAIGRLEKLRLLNIGQTKVEGHFLEGVPFPNLEELQSNYNEFDNEGLQFLARFPKIRSVELAHTQISNSGLEYLQGNQSLQRLGLAKTGISERGLKYLKNHPGLISIDLDETDVDDDVFEILLTMPRLSDIQVDKTDVTLSGIRNYNLTRCQRYRQNCH